jgi:WD40 repeat protein
MVKSFSSNSSLRWGMFIRYKCLVLLRNSDLACLISNGTLEIWNSEISDGQYLRSLTFEPDSVVLKLPNEQLAVISEDVSRIRLYDADRGALIQDLTGHSGSVLCLLLLNESQLASGSADNSIKIWDFVSGQCLITLSGHVEGVQELFLCKNGVLASASLYSRDNSEILLWNWQTGQLMKKLESKKAIYHLLPLKQSNYLVTCIESGSRTFRNSIYYHQKRYHECHLIEIRTVKI